MITSWIRRHKTNAVRLTVLLVGCLCCSSVAWAQYRPTAGRAAPPGTRAAQPVSGLPVNSAANRATRPAIDEVYRTAAEANSVGQLEMAMQRCQDLLQQPMSPEDAGYLRELQAWLLNRRGEAYATAAGGAMDSGQEAEAVRLEQQAIADYNNSLELDPNWRALHNLGVSLAVLGQYDQAIASFAEAIDLNPNYANSRFNRAELWLEMQRYDLAEKDYTEVLQLEANDVPARLGRGHARFYLSRFDEALADFDVAIQLQQDNAVAYADRADLNAFMGRWEQAAQDYRRAIKLDRGLGRAYQSAAWLMATCPEPRYRDSELALRAAERAVQLDGTTDYRYLDTLAAAQANAQQYQAAQQSMERAMQVAPPDVQTDLQQRLTLYQSERPFRDQTR